MMNKLQNQRKKGKRNDKNWEDEKEKRREKRNTRGKQTVLEAADIRSIRDETVLIPFKYTQ